MNGDYFPFIASFIDFAPPPEDLASVAASFIDLGASPAFPAAPFILVTVSSFLGSSFLVVVPLEPPLEPPLDAEASAAAIESNLINSRSLPIPVSHRRDEGAHRRDEGAHRRDEGAHEALPSSV